MKTKIIVILLLMTFSLTANAGFEYASKRDRLTGEITQTLHSLAFEGDALMTFGCTDEGQAVALVVIDEYTTNGLTKVTYRFGNEKVIEEKWMVVSNKIIGIRGDEAKLFLANALEVDEIIIRIKADR